MKSPNVFILIVCLSSTVSAFTATTSVPSRSTSSMTKQHHLLYVSSMTDDTTKTTTTSSSVSSDDNTEKEVVLGTVKSHNHCQDPVLDRTILVRAAKGERTERTPVWLMRQAGRYMKAFRSYSDRIPFRERSETPAIAIELSKQCHYAYGMDGIIMFSDILTPLPCINIEFDIIKGTGPVISTKIDTEDDVRNIVTNTLQGNPIDFEKKLPFIKEILNTLQQEAIQQNTALIGFVGAPFTLTSYVLEQKSSKHGEITKDKIYRDMDGTNKCLSLLIDEIATLIGNYACYQIENGAEIIQIFESWAHQLNPQQFLDYGKPSAMKVIQMIKAKYPDVPVIYFANGGSSYLELQKDMGCDMIAIDYSISMKQARAILGPDIPISGNIDPAILKFGTQTQIENAVRQCIDDAGGPGNRHILNLGHGVMQGTPEINVKYLVDECKRYHS